MARVCALVISAVLFPFFFDLLFDNPLLEGLGPTVEYWESSDR
jgi:hypothetical protein